MFDEFYLTSIETLLEESSKKEKAGFDIKSIKDGIKNKTISSNELKTTLTKAVAHNPESLAYDLPSVMDIIFYTITLGIPAMINPLLAIPIFIATKVIRDTADAKIIGRYISNYNLQIKHVENKIASETNEEKKKFWITTKENLEEAKENLEYRKSQLRNDDEDINESVRVVEMFLKEYNQLTEEQKILLEYESLEESLDIKKKAQIIKKTVNDKQDAMDKWFNDTLKSLRQKNRDNARDALVEDRVPKLSKMVRRAVTIGAGWAIHPAIAAITVVVQYALSKKTQVEERKKLLSELKREKEIVEEKIRDSDSSGDKKQKYQLMRLKYKLDTDIDRLKNYI